VRLARLPAAAVGGKNPGMMIMEVSLKVATLDLDDQSS
jgi:hypothetical protein